MVLYTKMIFFTHYLLKLQALTATDILRISQIRKNISRCIINSSMFSKSYQFFSSSQNLMVPHPPPPPKKSTLKYNSTTLQQAAATKTHYTLEVCYLRRCPRALLVREFIIGLVLIEIVVALAMLVIAEERKTPTPGSLDTTHDACLSSSIIAS